MVIPKRVEIILLRVTEAVKSPKWREVPVVVTYTFIERVAPAWLGNEGWCQVQADQVIADHYYTFTAGRGEGYMGGRLGGWDMDVGMHTWASDFLRY